MVEHERLAAAVGARFPRPQTDQEVEDHNDGVDMQATLSTYLSRRARPARAFFADLWEASLAER